MTSWFTSPTGTGWCLRSLRVYLTLWTKWTKFESSFWSWSWSHVLISGLGSCWTHLYGALTETHEYDISCVYLFIISRPIYHLIGGIVSEFGCWSLQVRFDKVACESLIMLLASWVLGKCLTFTGTMCNCWKSYLIHCSRLSYKVPLVVQVYWHKQLSLFTGHEIFELLQSTIIIYNRGWVHRSLLKMTLMQTFRPSVPYACNDALAHTLSKFGSLHNATLRFIQLKFGRLVHHGSVEPASWLKSRIILRAWPAASSGNASLIFSEYHFSYCTGYRTIHIPTFLHKDKQKTV